jgi:hypothetical protein
MNLEQLVGAGYVEQPRHRPGSRDDDSHPRALGRQLAFGAGERTQAGRVAEVGLGEV